MNKHTGTYSKWEVVVVPFPFADIAKAKHRPALVISQEAFNKANDHSILAMITTASQTKWASDTHITDLESCGLKTASVIRLKLFTLDNRLIVKKIGKLSNPDSKKLATALESAI